MKLSAPFESFGIDVFSDEEMQQRLDASVYAALYRTIEQGTELTFETATAVAAAMLAWALEKGATHYTHWFQPMTGSTAEKHDSFIDIAGLFEKPILRFSGKALIRGEADGSSFPSGGLRATFEARGYTTWDCTSPAFVKRDAHGGCLLCIPTAFCSFSGESLDEKTPLLRSMEAISREAVRVLHALGEKDVRRVIPTVGGEQEYFLIDKRHFLKRKDLVYTGRTLFGTPPAKGQELADQYYAATPERIVGFMRELNDTLWRMGVLAKTEHNEAAPAQYELAPLYASANVAVDHNQIIMEQMRRVAEKHGFVCLLHEKPFANVSGSGKHNNWSLTTDAGRNLLKPGKDEQGKRIFFTFFMAVIAAVDEYAGALRMSCATLGNEHRLGGHEAPPQIVSVFTGNTLYNTLKELASGALCEIHEKEHMHTGVSTLAVLHKDDTDRNRTSPFAFTGDKFEFRMVGSSQSLGMPNTALNTIVAEILSRMADTLEKDPLAWESMIGEYFYRHRRVIFNGNNYSEEWYEEAKRRKLMNIPSTVDAIALMCDPHIQSVFQRQCVLTPQELMARHDVALWAFTQFARIEALTMLKIARQKILPACIRYCGVLAQAYNETLRAGIQSNGQHHALTALSVGIDAFSMSIERLRASFNKISQMPDGGIEQARFICEHTMPAMEALRRNSDALERITDKEYWPLPSYGEMLFHIV